MFSTEELGFKKLTSENWRAPDPIWALFSSPDSPPQALYAWVDEFAAIQLSKDVPLQIRQLFEVARGAFVYAVMFYPLMTLGAEQACRVAEASVALKCRLLQAPAKANTFDARICWLVQLGIIAPEDEPIWQSLRFYRNHASHPVIQTILMPEMCLERLETVAQAVGKLFA